MGNVSITLDAKNYDEFGNRFKRYAVRGIIKNGDKFAMVYNSKHGYYEFPGGGMEAGEEKKDTLIREVQEETGLQVIPGSIAYWGQVREVRKGLYDDILDMTSYYYVCEVRDEVGCCNFDEHEEADGYQLRIVSIYEAIKNNEVLLAQKHMTWIFRDIEVMKKI